MKKSLEKALHDFFVAEQYHSPSCLEDIHRNEVLKDALNNAKKFNERPAATVMAIRKQSSL